MESRHLERRDMLPADIVEVLLTPVSESMPSGPDLEYDPDFMALESLARPVAEQQFGDTVIPAVEPDWRDIESPRYDVMLPPSRHMSRQPKTRRTPPQALPTPDLCTYAFMHACRGCIGTPPYACHTPLQCRPVSPPDDKGFVMTSDRRGPGAPFAAPARSRETVYWGMPSARTISFCFIPWAAMLHT